MIIQVQERQPAQSSPSQEQSTLKLPISGFNKKLPKKESKFTMWTLKIKLLISLLKVLRAHCLKNLEKDLDWCHQRKCDLSFRSPAWLAVPYYMVDNCKTVFQDFRTKFCPHMDGRNILHWKSQRRISERPNLFNLSIRLQILNLKPITNPKTECYLHYRGSGYCTEQEFGTFFMRSY